MLEVEQPTIGGRRGRDSRVMLKQKPIHSIDPYPTTFTTKILPLSFHLNAQFVYIYTLVIFLY